MKNKSFPVYLVLTAFVIILSACVRSASGSPESLPTAVSTLSNPVSTQSELMKEVIAGTQTAMAIASGADTPEATVEGEEGTPSAEATETETGATPEATDTPGLPTSTAGPPPTVELTYNNKGCGPGMYICTVSVIQDQKMTLQGTNSWLRKDWNLTFTMRPNGADASQGIVVGKAVYDTEGSPGFQVTLNIPDSLRGFEIIIVRLISDDCTAYYGAECFGQDYFYNTTLE